MCAYQLKENPVTEIFKEKVEELKSTMPVVTYFRDGALQPRHWEVIKNDIIGIDLNIEDEDFKLQNLIDLNVKKFKDKLGEISLKARKEQELDEMF